jgi:hypothetical protein
VYFYVDVDGNHGAVGATGLTLGMKGLLHCFPRRPAPPRVAVINPTCVVVVSLCRRPSTTLGRPRTPSVVDFFSCRALSALFVAAARVERCCAAVQPMVKSR